MSVQRLKHGVTADPYTRVPNAAINGLPPKSLGLYVFMLSKPEDWRFREVTIAKQMGVSRAQIRTAMADLLAQGWVTRKRHIENGVPVVDTTVHDQKQSESDESTENERTESVPLSNKRESKKAAGEGAAAPRTDSGDISSEPDRTLSSERIAGKSKGNTSERSITDSSYAARLFDELGDNAPDLDPERAADNYATLLAAAKRAGMDADRVAIGLALGLLVRTFGPLPEQARGLVVRLVRANGPTAVVDAAVTTAGSSVGLDAKWADDPLSPVRYMAGVVRGKR